MNNRQKIDRPALAPATRELLLQALLCDEELEAVGRVRSERAPKYGGTTIQNLDHASDRTTRSMARFFLHVADHLEVMLDREINYFAGSHGFGMDCSTMVGCFQFDPVGA